jgi:adenylate cyclase
VRRCPLAAREAFHRRDEFVAEDAAGFGIALDTREVIFGNVGTDKRLDFTVIGATVVKVSRVEEMTKELGFPLLATGAFSARVPEPAKKLGAQTLRGFGEGTDIVAYDIAG